VKTGHATYQMVFAGVIRVPENASREAHGYRPHLESYVRLLEGCVRDYPFQFFNYYDIWADPGDPAAERR